MLHSGSRGVGNVIGRYFISRVQKEMGNLLRRLPHKDLAEQTGGVECQKDRPIWVTLNACSKCYANFLKTANL